MEKKKDTDGLLEALKHKEGDVRIKAAAAPGRVGGEKAIEPLTQALRYQNRDIERAAKEALQKIRGKRS